MSPERSPWSRGERRADFLAARNLCRILPLQPAFTITVSSTDNSFSTGASTVALLPLPFIFILCPASGALLRCTSPFCANCTLAVRLSLSKTPKPVSFKLHTSKHVKALSIRTGLFVNTHSFSSIHLRQRPLCCTRTPTPLSLAPCPSEVFFSPQPRTWAFESLSKREKSRTTLDLLRVRLGKSEQRTPSRNRNSCALRQRYKRGPVPPDFHNIQPHLSTMRITSSP